MRIGLTRKQKTTVIYFDEHSRMIEVQTHNTDLKKRLTTFSAKHPECCRQTDDDEQGGLTFEIEKGRLSFRLTAPYSDATISDCEALADLRMRMRKELDSDFNSELIYAETLDFFKRNIKSGTHIAFVCEHNRQLIATAGISLFEMMPTTNHPNGRAARLMNMYVEPSFRHKGIAKELLNYAMMFAASKFDNYKHFFFRLWLHISITIKLSVQGNRELAHYIDNYLKTALTLVRFRTIL